MDQKMIKDLQKKMYFISKTVVVNFHSSEPDRVMKT